MIHVEFDGQLSKAWGPAWLQTANWIMLTSYLQAILGNQGPSPS